MRLTWLLLFAAGCAFTPPITGCVSSWVTGSGKHRVTHYDKNGVELPREELAEALAADPEASADERAAHRRENAAIGLFGFGYALVPTAMITVGALAASHHDANAWIVMGTALSAMALDMATIVAVASDAQRLRRRGIERYNEWAGQHGCR